MYSEVAQLNIRRQLIWMLLLLLSLLLTTGFLELSRRVSAVGVIIPSDGQISVLVPMNGIIAMEKISIGDSIEENQPLFQIKSTRYIDRGEASIMIKETIQKRIELLREEEVENKHYSETSKKSMNEKKSQIENQIEALRSELGVRNQLLELAAKGSIRARDLHAREFVSAAFVEAQIEKELNLKSQIVQLERQILELAGRMTNLKFDVVAEEFRLRKENISVQARQEELKSLDRETDARRAGNVFSPIRGYISSINLQHGQSATIGQQALVVSNDGYKIRARIYVPTKATGWVRIGTKSKVKLENLPYQKFGSLSAEIVEVSYENIPAKDLPPTLDPRQTFFIAIIEINKRDVEINDLRSAISSGSNLIAELDIEKKRLFEWIFSPFARLFYVFQ